MPSKKTKKERQPVQALEISEYTAFARAALTGLLASYTAAKLPTGSLPGLAHDAFEIAGAMMAELHSRLASMVAARRLLAEVHRLRSDNPKAR